MKTQKGLEIAISFIVAVFPALSVYNLFAGTSLAFALLWIVLIPLLVYKKEGISYNWDELFFFFGIFFISILSALIHLTLEKEWFDFTLFYHNLYSIAICLFPLFFLANKINVSVFVKTVLFFGVIASIVLIWQWFSLLFSGSFQKDLFFLGLEMTRNVDTFSAFRPSSFFTEPAHFAIYMLPAFQIALFLKKNVLIGLFAFAILCSGSSTGFMLLSLLLVLHLYNVGTKKWYAVVMYFIVFSFAVLVVFYVLPDVLLRNFNKLDSVRLGSSDMRLFGPIAYLSNYQFYEHMFGVSLNQLGNYLLSTGLSIKAIANYANAIIYMYISFGLAGFVLFVGYMVKKWKSIRTSHEFFFIFLGIACSDQILFNGHYLYLLMFVLLTDKIYNEKKNYKYLRRE